MKPTHDWVTQTTLNTHKLVIHIQLTVIHNTPPPNISTEAQVKDKSRNFISLLLHDIKTAQGDY